MAKIRCIFLITIVLLLGVTINVSFATESCNCVSFRLDDVQDYWLDNVQMKIIEKFQQKNSSLTVGIIGNYFGNDSKIVNLIKERSQDTKRFEIANHGWNHEDFTQFTEKQQSQLLSQTDQKIYNLFGVYPKVFIPPYDLMNNYSIEAMNENNLTYVSGNATTNPPPYYFHGLTPYRFPELAENGGINKQRTMWISSTIQQTYAQVLNSMLDYGFAVIVLHPQDFSVRHSLNYTNQASQTELDNLDALMEDMKHNGFNVVTIDAIPQNAHFHEYHPVWLNKVINWHSEKKISDIDFINSVEFLKSKGIIVFSNSNS